MSSKDKQVGGNHYRKFKIQPWDIIDDRSMNYYEGNVLKYLLRYKDKNGLEDLNKCLHYLEKLIEVETDKQRVSGVPYVPDPLYHPTIKELKQVQWDNYDKNKKES